MSGYIEVPFRFRQFLINQDRCAMKVGTDGVLLGAWAAIAGAERILDIGTGTGLIALMCAQRNPKAIVSAIEIDPAAVAQARENVAESKFADRIQVFESPLQAFRSEAHFDAIICNPPFFNAGTRSEDISRDRARHAASLSLDELLEYCTDLIAETGELHLILPLDRAQELADQCQVHGWFLARKTIVHPNFNRPPKRMLVTLQRSATECMEDELVIEKDKRFDYTDAYIELTREFYLGARWGN